MTFVSQLRRAPSYRSGALIGTSISSARLLPVDIDLQPHVPLHHAIDRRPTSIRTIVHNSGAQLIEHVTLVVQVDGKRITRAISHLLPNAQKPVTIPLPPDLPAHFTIRVHTQTVPGEGNTANNRSTWKIAVRA
jgi:hypothetical protein